MSWRSVRHKRHAQLIRGEGETCVYCGTTESLTVDHIIPRALGGSNSLSNCQILCFDCNQAKANTGAKRETVLRWRGIPVAT